MKKFLIRISLFLLPLSIFIIECFLPLNFFTYRPWEALLNVKNTGHPYPFYPNQTVDMYSVGELCHHRIHEIKKREKWITDKLGYRNSRFEEKPDILLVGDSFIAGSSLDQDSTLTESLKRKLKKKIYNIAPATFNDFIYLLDNKVIQKPKSLILSSVERYVPAAINQKNIKSVIPHPGPLQILEDRITRQYLIKYFSARLTGKNGVGVPGVKDNTLFFLKGVRQTYLNDKVDEVVANLVSYKNYCDSAGIDFIYLPMPNKETIYYENVPFEVQPDYLFILDSLLQQKNVKTINSLKLFNDFKASGNPYCYHKDDTHWNPTGVEIISSEIFKMLSEKD